MLETKTAKLGKGGRVVIPYRYRKSLGIKPGDKVIMTLKENEVRLYTLDQAIKRAQKIVRRYVPKGVSLVDELLKDRREEIRRG